MEEEGCLIQRLKNKTKTNTLYKNQVNQAKSFQDWETSYGSTEMEPLKVFRYLSAIVCR